MYLTKGCHLNISCTTFHLRLIKSHLCMCGVDLIGYIFLLSLIWHCPWAVIYLFQLVCLWLPYRGWMYQLHNFKAKIYPVWIYLAKIYPVQVHPGVNPSMVDFRPCSSNQISKFCWLWQFHADAATADWFTSFLLWLHYMWRSVQEWEICGNVVKIYPGWIYAWVDLHVFYSEVDPFNVVVSQLTLAVVSPLTPVVKEVNCYIFSPCLF